MNCRLTMCADDYAGLQFSIDAVEDGRKCLDQLQKAEYDVVLMDVSRAVCRDDDSPRADPIHASLRVKCRTWTASVFAVIGSQ